MQQKTLPSYELKGMIGYRENGWGAVVSTHDRFYSRNRRGLPTPAVTSRLMEKFEAIGNVQSRFQVWRKKQDMLVMRPTIGRGGGVSDSDTPTFFAFVGVDLEARWELNKGVCRARDGTNNNKIKTKTKHLLGDGYVGSQN